MGLDTYLNDRLTGSTAALELLDHFARSHPNVARFITELRRDIELDRRELESLMSGRQIEQSAARKNAAWFTETFARLKMSIDDPSNDKLELVESLEVLELGIQGKSLLWRDLSNVTTLAGPDYATLVRRADEQRERVEAARVVAAAFGNDPTDS